MMKDVKEKQPVMKETMDKIMDSTQQKIVERKCRLL